MIKYFFSKADSKLNPCVIKPVRWALVINLISLSIFCCCRPSIPLDEARYLSVAWEMFSQASYLVPTLNGETYAHKPILLFWIINFFWSVFGLSEVNARIAVSFFSLGSVIITFYLSKMLYPNSDHSQRWAPLILVAFPLWNIYSGTLMFDTMVCFFSLLQLLFMRLYCCSARFSYVLFCGIGLLAKGPVLLIYALPVLCCYPLWIDKNYCKASYFSWYFSLLVSIFISFAILLAWALPAASAGGEAYSKELLWSQTINRLSGVLAHNRPVYWYLIFIPLFFIPISISLKIKKWGAYSLSSINKSDYFCLLWFLLPCICLSLIKSKQLHYLLPTLPALAILLASKKIRSGRVLPYILITLTSILCLISHWLIQLAISDKTPYSFYQLTASIIAIAWGISIFICKHQDIRTALCLQSDVV